MDDTSPLELYIRDHRLLKGSWTQSPSTDGGPVHWLTGDLHLDCARGYHLKAILLTYDPHC